MNPQNTHEGAALFGEPVNRVRAAAAEIRAAAESPFAELAPLPVEADTPLLTEGILIGSDLTVTLPEGTIWKYTLAVREPIAARRLLMVLIDRHKPSVSCVFQPSIEGIHPFVGIANRYGVEGSRQ